MADVSYPYAQINARYGDLQSVNLYVYATGDGGPEGTDLDSVVTAVRTYLEGLEGIGGTLAYRTELVQTQLT